MSDASLSAASGPILDREHLARYTGGDAGLEAELFGLLDGQIDACVAMLAAALSAADGREGWGRATHTLKGAARGVGAMALGDACADAEARPLDPAALERVRIAADAARRAMDAARLG